MDENMVIQAMVANMQLHMTYFCRNQDHPVMELVVAPDAVIVRSAIPDDIVNYVVRASFSEANARQRVKEILSLYKELNIPFSWWVGECDAPAHLSEILLSEGLSYKEEDVGMYLHLEHFEPPTAPSGLQFERVRSLPRFKDFADVIMSIGGHADLYELIYSKASPALYQNEDNPVELYVGYNKFDQNPLVTGILVLHANAAGIYCVATRPEERRKGFATAMMSFLLARAKITTTKEGFRAQIATLQASQEGKALYERLGFRPCTTFKEYAWTGSTKEEKEEEDEQQQQEDEDEDEQASNKKKTNKNKSMKININKYK